MLSPAQKMIRRGRVGASEIGALVDYYAPREDGERVDPHKTAFDVFAERDCPSEEQQEHQRWGLDLEAAILAHYTRRTGLALIGGAGTLVHPTVAAICATPDGLAVTPAGTVRDLQAKNAQVHQAWRWGEAGSDDVPLLYVAQVTVELGILRAQPPEVVHQVEDEADVVVSIAGAPPVGFPIRWNAEVFGQLVTLAEKFKRDHIDPGKPPAITAATADSAAEWVRRKYPRHTGAVLEATDEDRALVQLVSTLRKSGRSLEEEKKAAEVQLKARIADAEGIDGLCTFRKNKDSIGPDWKAIALSVAAANGVIGEVERLARVSEFQIITRAGARVLRLSQEE